MNEHKRHHESYRGHDIEITKRTEKSRWSWLDHRAGEGFGFDTQQEAVAFARERINLYADNTVAFIWSHERKRYLGVGVFANDGDFCNSVGARLAGHGVPHAFKSVGHATAVLSEDVPVYNSDPDKPMRDDYNLSNCIVVEVELSIPAK